LHFSYDLFEAELTILVSHTTKPIISINDAGYMSAIWTVSVEGNAYFVQLQTNDMK
jgi:hypothetical protein